VAEANGVSGRAILADLPVPADEFAVSLVEAVDDRRAEIDALLERFAEGWTLGRMAALDRAALRMGSAELLARPDVPTGVVLAETVDLAGRFSTDGSGRFVNGLLARVAQEVRPGEPTAPATAAEPEEEDTPAVAPQVDGVIIDLDGVIRHWDTAHVPEAERRLGLPEGELAAAAFNPDRLSRAMDGRISAADWCDEIGADLAARFGIDGAAASAAWSASGWDIDLSVIEMVIAVRARVPVALLSNATTRLLEDLQRSGIDDAFDVVVGSADLGHAKPARAAFEAAAERLGVPLERCLFVDDTSGHVEAARRFGMRAEVFTDSTDLRELLTELGLLP
jgi:putative hydrolase of the HAD superfamily